MIVSRRYLDLHDAYVLGATEVADLVFDTIKSLKARNSLLVSPETAVQLDAQLHEIIREIAGHYFCDTEEEVIERLAP